MDISKTEIVESLRQMLPPAPGFVSWWESASEFPDGAIDFLVKTLWGAALAAEQKGGATLNDRVQFYQFAGGQVQLNSEEGLRFAVTALVSVRVLTQLDSVIPDSADWLTQLKNSLEGEDMTDLTPVLNKLDQIIANQSPYFSIEGFLAKARKYFVSETGGWTPEIQSFGGQAVPFWRIPVESGTGEIVLGDFTLGSKLRFMIAGGLSERPETKLVQLINTSNNNILMDVQAQSLADVRQDTLVMVAIDTTQWIGQTVRIKFIDNDSGSGWARMNAGADYVIDG
ncbi:hypothetical protein IQ249_24730 [Lusitaniella coriacea LEGE 07157]|uniref:Uncharacterized protein n=1 Tax=Lusitaniella coriacea LEGE 07157 TaxID=945747 RepID=A0A8J7E3B6_9CYAN|nr:hypothetical protein [Lusitaniella coriacea]MBE9119066.1 hypothetical protein [Lusitaniella coriacea LEGE 07157]